MSGAPFTWPAGFARVPADEWTRAPVEALAARYDTVENHGWYSNLEPTVDELTALLGAGDVLVDYSGGTGILLARLFRRTPAARWGAIDVDASPKFLRYALEKFRDDERVAFRHLRYLRLESRLEALDEVLGPSLARASVDAIVSTNAVHLYFGVEETFRSWARVLRPGGRALVQSGNVRNGSPGAGWIIDDTVEAAARVARDIVRERPEFERHRVALDDAARSAAYELYRRKVFPAPRERAFYERALEDAGLRIVETRTRRIEASRDDWFEFLAVYHDAILGWVGGSEKVDGAPPSDADVRDRLGILRRALERALDGA
ncbi:MAG: class I SAM-dependent methyltransferase, partial [Thermoplasmatota archaeon]